MRSLARETVLKYLFSELFNPSDEELFVALIKSANLEDSDVKFAEELKGYVFSDFDYYNSKVEELSIGFKADRIRPADKCAIIIGMAELKNCLNTPVPVIIDEAVKLSFKYSTEKSTDYVNGILATFAKEVR